MGQSTWGVLPRLSAGTHVTGSVLDTPGAGLRLWYNQDAWTSLHVSGVPNLQSGPPPPSLPPPPPTPTPTAGTRRFYRGNIVLRPGRQSVNGWQVCSVTWAQ